jgi:ketosteroid isomerase-like protein
MLHANVNIVNAFFEAYGKKDSKGLQNVLDPGVKWIFPGHHSFSGVKTGFDEVIAFFDAMSLIMGSSGVKAERFFMEANDNYAVEYQHVWTNRLDGNNLDHRWCVVWRFKNGKIIEGRHLAGDQHEVDRFFHKISQSGLA